VPRQGVKAAGRAAAVWLALTSGAAGAAPQPPDATRAELARWLAVHVRADAAGPRRWQYTFSAPVSTPLERLSLKLVEAGFAILKLEPLSAGGAELRVTRLELHTPATLQRRNRELADLAAAHGARYDGIDVAPQ